MSLFGNNYDEKISNLQESVGNIRRLFEELQESTIKIAKIQAQHKEIIAFLMNHASVDEDANEDLAKMMQKIMEVEKEVKE